MGKSDPESPNFEKMFLGKKRRTFLDVHTKNHIPSTKLRSKKSSLFRRDIRGGENK